MSFNQSTSDKNKYRKTGRSASSNQQHRGYSPAYPKGTGATVSVTNVSPQVSGMAPAQRGGIQNGAHAQPQLHGGSDVPIASTAPQTAEASAPQRGFRIVPKPPTSQSVSVTSDTIKPTTPAKLDASKGVAIQLGSISPGFMYGMQPQMGPQIPQMSNLGVSMASQCPQQEGRKFGGPRKTRFKITHPDTHEELRLDKRTDSYSDGGPSAPRTHPNIPPQSQPIPSFAHPHTTTYYANSYNPSPLYYPAPSSHPLTSSHMPPNSQAPRFIYPVSQGSQPLPFINPSSHSRTKSTISKGKKKRKEILSKTDAAGVTSDLYGAYKNPEEKKGIENTESIMTSIISKQVATDAPQQDAVGREKDAPVKAEPEDWEDAADISTLKLETSDTGELVCAVDDSDKDGHELGAKKYSRDFLLKFSVQFTELPEGFEIMSDIAQILNANVNAAPSIDYDLLPSPGRIVDRQGGAIRLDPRGSGIMDDDRWNKGGAANFRTGQGPNFGVLRNPRAPTPVQQHVRGILPVPAHSVDPQGGMQRNNYDADRWQRATNFQPKGLMPSPPTPLQLMHKAERKYEVGKVSDEEQAKQRQLKAILNKSTPQNFEKLFEQVKAVNIDNATTLTGVISQIFDKALMEPTFCEMYANFCFYLAGELPDFCEDNDQITFKRLLYNKCQEEFERGGREQEETNKAYEEGQVKQSEEEREEKRIKARRQRLGNISLIGELYKKRMLTERIMHECIKKLFGQQQTPVEQDIEALCKLMSTIGEMIDHPKAKEYMDAYFERMKSLSNNMKLSSRVRFMLNDAIDLRKNKWQQRRKVEGRIKIEEVHRDAAQERQAQSSRLARGPGINPSARRGPPMEFSPRGSTMLCSPNAHMGGFRGMPAQVRGYGSQDVRTDERHSYESRTLSVPLTQRPIGDDSITLGPQSGLARGMSIRGPPSMSAAPLAEMPPSAGDSRRMTAGSNGFSSLSDRTTYNPREDPVPRYMPDRFSGPAAYDQSSVSERNLSFGGRDLRSSDHRTLPTSPPTRAYGAALTKNVPSENVLTEDRLRDMSLAAIREFYSAGDEKEVALCIKELNSPSFHPSMISLWITDSFERKDAERYLLAKLLVNLTKTNDATLSQSQLIKGFETVLSTLEDAVIDTPRAPEFLGFAKVILENVVSLNQIGQLIHEGGEEPRHLLEVGLAGNILGNV